MQRLPTTVYTIGHSSHSIERFIALLRRHAIRLLVDVRSHPYSKWAPQFRKGSLSNSLEAEGIAYIFLGEELGGQPEGASFYDVRGQVDYQRRAQAPDFQAGIERLAGAASRQCAAILCAEESPERCHRRWLVTPALQQMGLEVRHIRADGRAEADGELPARTPQLALFELGTTHGSAHSPRR